MGTVIAVTAALVAPSLVTTAPAAAAFQAPVTERLIGGPTRPGVAAWGLAYNPVTDEMIVGDYVANQIRRYSRTGSYLGDFVNPGSDAESIVSAVAVDPRDGSVYAAATSLTSPLDIRKYDAQGRFLFGFDVPGRVAWLTVDDQGYVWFPEAYGSHVIHKYAVNDTTKSASQVLQTGKRGSGPGQSLFLNGIDAADSGDIFAADAINNRVHVFGSDGVWKRDIGGPSVFTGDLRGIAVDDISGRVYVSDAKATEIDVFDLAGNHLLSVGSEGDGPGQFGSGARQVAVTPDGHVWGADYSASRVLEFAPDGSYLSRFPSPPSEPDPHGLVEPWGVGVDQATGDVLTADHWGQRIQRFDAQGDLLQVFGRRGRGPEDSVNYPRAVASDPATGHVWVLNAEGAPYLVEYDRDFRELQQIVTYDLSTGLEIVNGEIYVAYRSRGIQVFDPTTGALKRQYAQVGDSTYQGIGVDPATGRMWVPIRDSAQVRVLEPNGTLKWTLATDRSPTDVAFIGDTAYVTDTGANEVIAFDRTTGTRLGVFGKTGKYQLLGPKGIDVGPDGKLYVSEVKGARVQVFAFATPPGAETVKPTVTFAKPAGNRSNVPVDLTGTAADASGIGTVEVSVRNLTTGRYWNVRSGTWATSAFYNQATVAGDPTNVAWRFRVIPVAYGESYELKIRATDRVGNARTVTGTVLVDDVTPPTPTIEVPAAGAVLEPGVVGVTGHATDDGFVGMVELGLHDPATNMWWDAAGGWTGPAWHPVALATDGSWTGALDLGALAGSGPFELVTRAHDLRGNVGTSAPVAVSVGSDTVAPETTVTVPTVDQQLPGNPTLTGSTSDAVGVTAVDAAVMNRDTGLWWDSSTGTWGGIHWNPADLDAPGGRTPTWSLAPPLGDGFYFVQARARDAAGNVDATPATARFSVSTSVVDLLPPDTTVVTPTKNQVVAAPPTITGTATDDLSVARVQVALKNRTTNLWWNQATGTWGPITWHDAALGAPGAASTPWSWSAAVGPGDYLVQARARDGAKRLDPTVANVPFSARAAGTVPWLENFDLPDGTRADTGVTAWTLDYAGTGAAEVRGGDLYFQTMGGTAEWRSEPLAIGGLAAGATVRVTWRGSGALDPPDTITAYYRVNGGPLVQFAQRTDDFTSQTVSVPGIAGSTVEVVIRSYSTGNDEAHIVSQVEVVPS